MSGVCREQDDFIQSKYLDETLWVATLSDGTTAYQDDGRPGLDERSAWVRLRRHCLETGVRVTGISLRFRSRTVVAAPEGAAAYFFRKNIVGFASGGANQHCYLVGWQEEPGGPVKVVRWRVPELVPTSLPGEDGSMEERDPADPQAVGDSLIPGVSS